MVDEPKPISRSQFDRAIANLHHEIRVLKKELDDIKKKQEENEKEHKDFYKNVIRALLGIIGAIASGFSAIIVGGMK